MEVYPKIHSREGWAICITAFCRDCDNRETKPDKEAGLWRRQQSLEFPYFFKIAIGL